MAEVVLRHICDHNNPMTFSYASDVWASAADAVRESARVAPRMSLVCDRPDATATMLNRWADSSGVGCPLDTYARRP